MEGKEFIREIVLDAARKNGVPEPMAQSIADGAAGAIETLDALVEAKIEEAHARTFLAYVQASTHLLSIDGVEVFGKQVLDVARAMFESALEEGDEEREEKATDADVEASVGKPPTDLSGSVDPLNP